MKIARERDSCVQFVKGNIEILVLMSPGDKPSDKHTILRSGIPQLDRGKK